MDNVAFHHKHGGFPWQENFTLNSMHKDLFENENKFGSVFSGVHVLFMWESEDFLYVIK